MWQITGDDKQSTAYFMHIFGMVTQASRQHILAESNLPTNT